MNRSHLFNILTNSGRVLFICHRDSPLTLEIKYWMFKSLRRFPLDGQAVSEKKKVTKEILTALEYFERINEETTNTFKQLG